MQVRAGRDEAKARESALVATETLRTVLDWAGSPRVCVLLGPAGFGKSTVARWLFEHGNRQFERRVLVERGDLKPVGEFIPNVVQQLGGRPSDRDVVIIDGLDESGLSTGELALLWREIDHASRRASFFVTSRNRDHVDGAGLLDSRKLLTLTTSALTDAELRDFATRLGGADGERLFELLSQAGFRDPLSARLLIDLAMRSTSLDDVARWVRGQMSGVMPELILLGTTDQIVPVLSGGLPQAEVASPGHEALAIFPHVTRRTARELFKAELEQLRQLVNDPAVRERDLQEFFEQHPALLAGVDYERVVAHPVLSREGTGPLVPDFMLEPAGGGLADILDLKLPQPAIVVGRKDRLRLSQSVHDALAQVREYRAYFEDGQRRALVAERYGLQAYRPQVAVVIGRRPQGADVLQLRRVWDEDVPDGSRVITYDDLIARITRMGRQL